MTEKLSQKTILYQTISTSFAKIASIHDIDITASNEQHINSIDSTNKIQ